MKELFDAARNGDLEAIRKIHAKSPKSINAQSKECGSTALHEAARYGNALTAYVLLSEAGANPHLRDHHNHRPLDIAQWSDAATQRVLREATHARLYAEASVRSAPVFKPEIFSTKKIRHLAKAYKNRYFSEDLG
ncbi:ankyrin repeat domain-containing protein [Parvularcula sp. LCG005]|uniref:ankyrin repeat domain-containing protein n=1 Tax=Parvularcula sp. LCG005 TaxID=3078805 RepID=UPI002941E889|nr:ankyrin repeat domain-containing protein [Parvularcula sp. LCG005]WOI52573.1 ankyrin repeat domain-containing protein [Parvularcula sp. LCG005]